MIAAKFSGGPLDGKTRHDVCARRYLHELPSGRYAEYKRTGVRYVDGANYASDANQGRVAHLEYAYTREGP